MEPKSIYVFFNNKEGIINITPYFTKFIQDIQKLFKIDNKNLNDYQIYAQVEFNDKTNREYPINNESNYRNIMLGNYFIQCIRIEKKEIQKNKFVNQNSNNSIKNNSFKKNYENSSKELNNSIKKNYYENSPIKLNNIQTYNELKKYVDKELNILKNEVKEIKDNNKNIFLIIKEIQNNINNISNYSTTPSTINSTKNVVTNNYNNNINENSNSLSKGISKSIVYNKNNDYNININKEQSIRNINVFNSSVSPSNKFNVNKNNNYKVLFNLNEKKFPVVIKSQINNIYYRNLEIQIRNIGSDLPAYCKIKSLNNNYMKIDPVFINNGKPIKNNEEVKVNLTIKFEMIKNIKQGFYDIQICLFNEYYKDINIICDEKIKVQIIDSEKNIVDNNNKKPTNNNYLIENEVSNYNLFDNRNLNYLNNMNKYNINKNVGSSLKNSSNIYMTNKKTNY